MTAVSPRSRLLLRPGRAGAPASESAEDVDPRHRLRGVLSRALQPSTVNDLRQAGVKPSWIKLADRGIDGNSHVMMMEKNSKQIADVIIGWSNKAITAAPARAAAAH